MDVDYGRSSRAGQTDNTRQAASGRYPESSKGRIVEPYPAVAAWPLLICILGPFRVLRAGQPIPVHGDKVAALLSYLALRHGEVVPRDTLLEVLWPEADLALAAHALHGRVSSLRKLLGPTIGGGAPVVCADGCYFLNDAAGVGVDVACFEALLCAGDQQAREGYAAPAAATYQRAMRLYRGDLRVETDARGLLERERLRACYLTLLSRLADYAYGEGDYGTCLDYARRLLAHDPCREDAHRLVMRCHVRRGERAQALHQYRLCADLLRAEFAAAPERATVDLFEQVRLDPDRI